MALTENCKHNCSDALHVTVFVSTPFLRTVLRRPTDITSPLILHPPRALHLRRRHHLTSPPRALFPAEKTTDHFFTLAPSREVPGGDGVTSCLTPPHTPLGTPGLSPPEMMSPHSSTSHILPFGEDNRPLLHLGTLSRDSHRRSSCVAEEEVCCSQQSIYNWIGHHNRTH